MPPTASLSLLPTALGQYLHHRLPLHPCLPPSLLLPLAISWSAQVSQFKQFLVRCVCVFPGGMFIYYYACFFSLSQVRQCYPQQALVETSHYTLVNQIFCRLVHIWPCRAFDRDLILYKNHSNNDNNNQNNKSINNTVTWRRVWRWKCSGCSRFERRLLHTTPRSWCAGLPGAASVGRVQV